MQNICDSIMFYGTTDKMDLIWPRSPWFNVIEWDQVCGSFSLTSKLLFLELNNQGILVGIVSEERYLMIYDMVLKG